MPSELEWRNHLRDLLNDRIARRDVQVALRVEADPAFGFADFDDGEFAEWVEDWIGFTIAATAGPVMPGTAENEWVVGDNDALRIKLLLVRGGDPNGGLIVE